MLSIVNFFNVRTVIRTPLAQTVQPESCSGAVFVHPFDGFSDGFSAGQKLDSFQACKRVRFNVVQVTLQAPG